jgi:hypothetical protein
MFQKALARIGTAEVARSHQATKTKKGLLQ